MELWSAAKLRIAKVGEGCEDTLRLDPEAEWRNAAQLEYIKPRRIRSRMRPLIKREAIHEQPIGWHRAASDPKRVSKEWRKRTYPRATQCITYTLRDRRLYVFEHDIAYYVSAYQRGHLTRGEFREIIDWINAGR